ncbi:pre-mRNA-splicing factor cwc2 [Pelomyxa schiedti]|nr:pre-mRNA-splicing factor cwc2 [Pelomyxa schiedti]
MTRVNILKDAGRTHADDGAPVCIHFAMGKCALGSECSYKHQIPTEDDERRTGLTQDVFGRERYKTDRDDMGGVGNFSKENRTLYLGGLKTEVPVPEMETSLRKHFGEFGELEYVRVLAGRGIGFVRYRLRTAAEFAKVAMGDQTLDHGEVLNVRWAYTDPNPIAKAHEEQATASQFINAVERRVQTVCCYIVPVNIDQS